MRYDISEFEKRVEQKLLRKSEKGAQLFINYGYDPIYGLKVTKRNKERLAVSDEQDKEKETHLPCMSGYLVGSSDGNSPNPESGDKD